MTSKKRYPSGAREGDGFLFSVHIWIPEGDPVPRKWVAFPVGCGPLRGKGAARENRFH